MTYMSNTKWKWEGHDEYKLDDEYHKYTIEWTPDYMSFSIDDTEIRHLEGEEVDGI